MIDPLLPLLGKSIENEDIKALLIAWNVKYPKPIFCTPDAPVLKAKIEKDCIRLVFGMGGGHPLLELQPTKWEGGFIALFTNILFTPKRKNGIPFDVDFNMSPQALTAILGPAKTDKANGTTTWRKNYETEFEFVVVDTKTPAPVPIRSMQLGFASV